MGKGYRGQPFYCDIERCGWDNFDHDVLIAGLSVAEAHTIESGLIEKYQTYKPRYGYNQSSLPVFERRPSGKTPPCCRVSLADAVGALTDALVHEVDVYLGYLNITHTPT